MSCHAYPEKTADIFSTPTLASSRNDLKNSTLVMSHYPDLGSASDWSCCNMFQPLRGTTKSWIVTRYQYGTSTLASQTLFRGRGVGEAVLTSRNVGCYRFSSDIELRMFIA